MKHLGSTIQGKFNTKHFFHVFWKKYAKEFEGLFIHKTAPGLNRRDEDFQASQCFTEVIRGYRIGVIEATRWLSWYGVGLASADRLPVVVRIPAGPLGSLKCDPPKGNGRRPQKKISDWCHRTSHCAQLSANWSCPSFSGSNHTVSRWNHPRTVETGHAVSPRLANQRCLLRLWHHPKSLHQFKLADRVMFQQPANYFSDAALQEHWCDLVQSKVILPNLTPKKADVRRTGGTRTAHSSVVSHAVLTVSLVFWILFWEPWWSRFVGIRGAKAYRGLPEARIAGRHAWQARGHGSGSVDRQCSNSEVSSGDICLCLVWFLVLFAAFSDETQVWLGDLRVVVVFCLCCFVVCVDLPARMDQLCPYTNIFSQLMLM